uniref:Uncharacterized protein n=1 Tax=Pipistrellus kuhlii TaxID=59472 RepID=A0A7J7W311_PIPKU|nr:hypothetical protein mPipKuh1_008165 [Pipistrellus kuhlii]
MEARCWCERKEVYSGATGSGRLVDFRSQRPISPPSISKVISSPYLSPPPFYRDREGRAFFPYSFIFLAFDMLSVRTSPCCHLSQCGDSPALPPYRNTMMKEHIEKRIQSMTNRKLVLTISSMEGTWGAFNKWLLLLLLCLVSTSLSTGLTICFTFLAPNILPES